MSTDEYRVALKAHEVLSTLKTSTPRAEKTLNDLRHAARYAADSTKGFSSQAALDNLRGEAATALNGVAGSLAKGELSQAMIDRAKAAVLHGWRRSLQPNAGILILAQNRQLSDAFFCHNNGRARLSKKIDVEVQRPTQSASARSGPRPDFCGSRVG